MTADARTFHALQFFGQLSTESVKALALDGGYMAMATKYAEKCAQVERLRAELARVSLQVQRAQGLPA